VSCAIYKVHQESFHPDRVRYLLSSYLLLALSAFAQQRSPVVSTTEPPIKAEKIGEGHWFIDFGTAAFGNVEITSPDAAPNTKVTVHLGEAAAKGNTVNRKPGGSVRYQSQQVVLKARTAVRPAITWQPMAWMKPGAWVTNPKESGETAPFRYVELEQMPASFAADQIKRISWHVPFDEKASSFESSSPDLDAVWKLCKYSIKATSFLGLYVDGDRERTPYEADALINQLSHYCVDARYDTARLTHEFLLEKPTWPTEWRLQSVMIAWYDYLYSGDDTSLRKHYQTLVGRAMIEKRSPEGFFLGSNAGAIRDIVDWPAAERDGYDMTPPVKTVVTAFHYQALVMLEKIATRLGKTSDAKRFASLAEATRKSVNEKLWDPARNCYVDALDPATGKASTHASTHANFFALSLGLVPEDRVKPVAAFLKSKGMLCSVYGSQFLLDALYDAGEGDFALKLMTSRDKRSWLNMSEKVGSTITLEAWDPTLKPNLDWNHAWGAAAANLIPRKLMGIEPIEPGFSKVRIRPQTGSLTKADIRFPSPKGPILLSIKRPNAATWQAQVTIPAGSAAEFHVPPHAAESLKLSTGAPRILRTENGCPVLALLPGTHQISIKPN
jgi:alpha-L-rhamnosidase